MNKILLALTIATVVVLSGCIGPASDSGTQDESSGGDAINIQSIINKCTVKGDLEATSRFIDAIQIPFIAASFGGVETLIEQPALMSFYELSTAERLEVGIPGNLVRLSLGIEDAEDLISDLDQALRRISD